MTTTEPAVPSWINLDAVADPADRARARELASQINEAHEAIHALLFEARTLAVKLNNQIGASLAGIDLKPAHELAWDVSGFADLHGALCDLEVSSDVDGAMKHDRMFKEIEAELAADNAPT